MGAYEKLGELKLGDVVFEVREGLLATVHQADVASSVTINAAYAGLAKREDLHPEQEPRREAVGRALQQAWYEKMHDGEPARVKARRLGLWSAMRIAPEVKPKREAAPRYKTEGQSVAELIRKSLKDGASTDEILKLVAIGHPGAKADAKVVAYYRHQLRKRGELPPAKKGNTDDNAA